MLDYCLRDPDLLLALVRNANNRELALGEKHFLVVVSEHVDHSNSYDISKCVCTLSDLLQTGSVERFFDMFNGWKVIARIPLTICFGKRTVSFLPGGIIEFYSQDKGTTVLHASDPEVFDKIRNCLH